MVGTIFRLPDDQALQRGVTFTIMPDGTHKRVPAMQRLDVRAQNQAHANDEHGDIMQALQNILKGRKPMPGEARHAGQGRAHGNRGRYAGAHRVGPGIPEGLRPVGGAPPVARFEQAFQGGPATM